MRKLVSIRNITNILPIPQADRVETAVIDGWTCVVKKGEFAIGDPCVFFEIDSFIPASDTRFDFLAKSARTWRGTLGYRIKTMKLAKQLSQGLVLPISTFPEIETARQNNIDISGDIAELLHIQKWEEDAAPSLSGMARGNFPSFIPKTDEERIQNIYNIVDKDAVYEVTVKMDGTSSTFYHNDGIIGVCSRNLDLKIDENPDNSYIIAGRKSGMMDKLKSLNRNLAVQAELCGPGINQNRQRVLKPTLFVFKMYDIDNKRYLSYNERMEVMKVLYDRNAEIPLLHTPIVGFRKFPEMGTLETLLNFADGVVEFNEKDLRLNESDKNPLREGLVFKKSDGSTSFKVISNKYIFEHGL